MSDAPEIFLSVGQRAALRLLPPPYGNTIRLAGIDLPRAAAPPGEAAAMAEQLRREVAGVIDCVLNMVSTELAGREGLSEEDWRAIKLAATRCWATQKNREGRISPVILENLLFHCAYMNGVVHRMKQDNGYQDGLDAARALVEQLQARVEELEAQREGDEAEERASE